MMEITLQYFDGCPNWETTDGHLSEIVREGVDVTIERTLIDSHEAAVDQGFRGSPTVLIDGIDPFGDEHAPVGLSCRIYQTENGPAGSPSLAQLRDAIRRRDGDPSW